MATRLTGRTSLWRRSRRGPWPRVTLQRLEAALDALVARLRAESEVLAVVVFGSYGRGDFSRQSDVDLLVLLPGRAAPERTSLAERIRKAVNEAETEHRLPMHLAPLIADVEDRATLTNELIHDIWRDGLALYAHTSALALLRPEGLAPWSVFRFSVRGGQADRVRLSRKLHGMTKGKGLIRPPALTLARGAVLVPADQAEAVRGALDEVGATYDQILIWRST